ncbi:MAG TPA: cytochrome b N-terminal domain-containing protein [Planctomycetota bacterium]|nr:cytochrome b N-terminal domain-containing protein [Planctomycetota bacterium]
MSRLEERIGLRSLIGAIRERLSRPLPPNSGGAVLGSMAVFFILIQVFSGALLAIYYVPSWSEAHASVVLIAKDVTFGWLVRSVHVWSAHLLVATVLLHLVRVFARGSYGKPREVTWLTGAALLGLLMGSAFTGQMLPMDDEAVKGAEVGAAYAREAGLANLVQGGPHVGPPMLTRMFAAHVILVPIGIVLLVAAHLALVGRHRLHGAEDAQGSSLEFLRRLTFALFGSAALLAVLAIACPAGVGPSPGGSGAPVKPMWMFLPVYQAAKWVSGPATLLLLMGPPAFLVAVPFLPRRLAVAAGTLILAAALVFGIWGAAS